MKTEPLWQYAETLADVFAEIDENEGVIDEHLETRLDAAQLDFDEKVAQCCMAIRQAKGHAEMVGNEIERLMRLREPYINKAESLRRYVESQLRKVGRRKAGTPMGKAYLQRNPPSVIYDGDPGELPDWAVRKSIDVNRSAILERHRKGEPIPAGCRVEQTESVRTR